MDGSQLLQVGLAFLFVVALMMGLAHIVKRFDLGKRWQTQSSTAGLLHLEDTLFLDAKRRVIIINCDKKRYLILMDQDKAHVLDAYDADTIIAPTAAGNT